MTATTKGKEFALEALRERRANPPAKIDNASLHAGSPMYFYCDDCGALSDVLPEDFTGRPNRICYECRALKEAGWLE